MWPLAVATSKKQTKEREGGRKGNKPKQRRARQQHRKLNENGCGGRMGKEIEMWLAMIWQEMVRYGAPSPWESAFCLVPISFHFAFSHVHSQIKLQTAQMCVKTHTHRQGKAAGQPEGSGRREEGEGRAVADSTHT